MFSMDQLKKAIKKDNWHFQWFKKSSLSDLLALLERKMPRPTANEVAKVMGQVPPDKQTKYTHTFAYLKKAFPGLPNALVTSRVPLGESPVGYRPGKLTRFKDMDNRWHEIFLQGKDNSCGPACVLMVKMLVHPNAKGKLREPEIRGLIAQAEAGTLHSGVSSLSQATKNLHQWQNVGSQRPPLIKILNGQPFPVRSARGVTLSRNAMYDELQKCSPKRPAIVGFAWQAGGGHWTVCIGPTRDRLRLVILDPWDGLQYVKNDRDRFTSYQNGQGTMEHTDPLLSPTLTH